MAGERFQGGERALQRAALDAFRPPVGEKGAQIAWGAVGEIGDARRRAEALLEKGEKLPGVAAVSLDRARRQAPLVGEMVKPGGGRSGEVGRGGRRAGVGRSGLGKRGFAHRSAKCPRDVRRTLSGTVAAIRPLAAPPLMAVFGHSMAPPIASTKASPCSGLDPRSPRPMLDARLRRIRGAPSVGRAACASAIDSGRRWFHAVPCSHWRACDHRCYWRGDLFLRRLLQRRRKPG